MPSQKTKKIKAVLFDLGKVLLHFNFEPAFRRLAKDCRRSPKEVEDFFVQSGLECLYDGGRITSREFHGRVRKALGLRMGFTAFRAVWNDIFTPVPGMRALVERLRKTHRLVLVSNTNEMHFKHIRKKYPVMKNFDALIASYQHRVRKPDERIYKLAAKACKAKPGEIFYIDDRADLTEAAAELGFHTFTFRRNAPELIGALKKAGAL
jgi:epoxide hydrolase-like predicted phosphatase